MEKLTIGGIELYQDTSAPPPTLLYDSADLTATQSSTFGGGDGADWGAGKPLARATSSQPKPWGTIETTSRTTGTVDLSDAATYNSDTHNYLGCWEDEADRRMELTTQYSPGSEATVEQCARWCAETATGAPYMYFSVQNKNECFCSNDLERTRSKGEATCSACTNSVDAEAGRECGGSWANSVYELPGVAYPYLGCWHDKNTATFEDRLMEAKTNLPQENGYQYGVAWCAHYCAKNSTGAPYDYFAVQHQSECFCSNNLDRAMSMGATDADDCELCTLNEGDTKKGLKCGAQWTGHASTATGTEERGWWRVELQESAFVSAIKLYNRPDCCQEGLNFASVWLDGKRELTLPKISTFGTEKKVQKLAGFVADAVAYMVDNAVGGTTKIADAGHLENTVANTTAAAIEAIYVNL
eukprot:g1567.t1